MYVHAFNYAVYMHLHWGIYANANVFACIYAHKCAYVYIYIVHVYCYKQLHHRQNQDETGTSVDKQQIMIATYRISKYIQYTDNPWPDWFV